jgi:hypothetical protein
MKQSILGFLLLAGCGSDFQGSFDAADAAVECSGYLVFPGQVNSYASFWGPDVPKPLTVELRVRLGADGRIGLVRRDAGSCGWHVDVEAGRIRAGVGGGVDHEESRQIAGTGWHTIRWELGEYSVLRIDGQEVGRRSFSGDLLPCSGQTILGEFLDGAGAPSDWSLGEVDHVRIASSTWNFDEREGIDLEDEDGAFPGAMLGAVTRGCE